MSGTGRSRMSPWAGAALSLVSFAGTVACAIRFQWTARDLLWGLWISSLSVSVGDRGVAFAGPEGQTLEVALFDAAGRCLSGRSRRPASALLAYRVTAPGLERTGALTLGR
jgi:hypothetical protein